MCGRFALINNPLLLMSLFNLPLEEDFRPVYNIAPSFQVLTAWREQGTVVVGRKGWNYKPHWAREDMKSVINARIETAFEKPYFRSAIKKHRCIVPASGFFEWKKPAPGEKRKTPYYIYPDEKEFLFAGLYEGDGLALCTQDASEKMSPVHDRMPVILLPDDAEAWLSSEDTEEVKAVVGRSMDVGHAHPISSDVNSPAHNAEQILDPVGDPIF